jgi:anti-sigma-K factor RskA
LDINSIISSGILESYVLGTATAEETKQVQELCMKHPELIKEMELIENTLIKYSENNAPKISSAFKEHLFSKLNDRIIKAIQPRIIPIVSKASTKKQYIFAAAAVTLFIISSVFNIMLYSKLQKVNSELLSLNNEKTYYANQMKVQQTTLKGMESNMAFLASSETKKIKLKSTDTTAHFSASIYWNSTNHETYISLAQLPIPPKGKQYQLWAIINGKPIDAGVFDMTTSGIQLQKMKNISEVQAFAVTLEKEGGSVVPTLSTMCLLGNA